MFYKYIYILPLFISILFSQANFNRVFGQNIYFGDARSMAMGNTYATTGTTSNLILSNPAKISALSDNIVINLQFDSRYHNERKGIIVKDFFDDIITEADYVFNQNNYYNHSFGLILNRKIDDNFKIGLALAKIPLTSFDYNYVEEVRGRDATNNVIIGSQDPLMGYHILKSKGEISLHSVGFSFSFINQNGPISIGIGVNEVISGKITDIIKTNIVNPSIDPVNLANVEDYINISNIRAKNKRFLSYSISLPILENIDLTLSYEDDIDIVSTNYPKGFQLSPYLGLPSIVGFENGELKLLLHGLYYNKPEKINLGFTFKPKSRKSLIFTFEGTNSKMKYYILNSDDETIVLKDELFDLKIGFEHHVRYRFPIRAGFQYKENFKNLDATSIFTLGTGKSFKLFDLDFALNYSMNNYKYYDIFPIQSQWLGNDFFDNGCINDVICNNVKESELTLLTTVRVGF